MQISLRCGDHVLAYGRQSINQDDIAAVIEILQGDYLTTGPAVPRFEEDLARACRAPYAVAVSSGTAALHIAMLALGIGTGDTVLVPAITFAATANAARYCGAHVVFVDIRPDTGCMDPAALAQAIQQCLSQGGRPRMVVPVHFAGQPCDMPAIHAIAQQHKLSVLEDACHALGASFTADGGDATVGDCRYSDATVFSFHPVKHITTGEGGAITTRDAALAQRLRSLRSHGIVRDNNYVNRAQALDEAGQPNPWYVEMRELGYNYRLTDIQAALGSSQLQRLNHFVDRRRHLAHLYRQTIPNLVPSTSMLAETAGTQSSYHLCVVQVDFRAVGRSRADIMSRLGAQGIGSQVHYLPVYRHPYYQKVYGDLSASCPRAEHYYTQTLSLPLYPDLADSDVQKVCRALAQSLKD